MAGDRPAGGGMLQRDQPARIGIVLYDGVEPIDLGGTLGVISMASRLLPGLSATTIAEHAGPVRCAGGLTVLAAHGFADVAGWAPLGASPEARLGTPPGDATRDATCDVVVVAGGPGWAAQSRNPAMLAFLRGLDLALLAAMGAAATAAQIVDAGGPVTGGGVSLAHDLTLHLIGRLYGEAARDEVARLIEYDRAFAANRAALGIVVD